MKKLTLIIIAMFMMTFASQAQYIFNKGDIGINAGLGIGGSGGLFPSIEVSGEYGAIPTGDIGLVSFGGTIGYKYSTYDYYLSVDNYSYNYSQIILGARGAWHLHTFTSDQWDVYAGLGFGLLLDSEYNSWDIEKNEAIRTAHTGVYEEVFIGGRMMMKSNFGLFAEVGYSQLSNIRFGLTFLM